MLNVMHLDGDPVSPSSKTVSGPTDPLIINPSSNKPFVVKTIINVDMLISFSKIHINTMCGFCLAAWRFCGSPPQYDKFHTYSRHTYGHPLAMASRNDHPPHMTPLMKKPSPYSSSHGGT